jgi:AraC family transcriptional regulator
MLTGFHYARVAEFVDARLATSISLADLAGVVGGSLFHFARAFKNSVGVTPYQFVIRRRIERARTLLAGTDLRIDEVAARCGFNDAMHLSKTFVRLVGRTPSRYRREHPRR